MIPVETIPGMGEKKNSWGDDFNLDVLYIINVYIHMYVFNACKRNSLTILKKL
jgi:hypothetical protein